MTDHTSKKEGNLDHRSSPVDDFKKGNAVPVMGCGGHEKPKYLRGSCFITTLSTTNLT
jgi:hypothetical protein